MKSIYTKLTVFFAILTAGITVLFVNEQQQASLLASQLSAAQTELEDLEALKSGLEEANEELRSQVDDLNSAPPMFTLGKPEEVENVKPIETYIQDPEPEAITITKAEPEQEETTELTPEQQAANEEREKRRQAYREERDKRRAQYRERVSTEVQTRREFFNQINTEGLAPEYQQAHTRLMEALDEVDAGMAVMANRDIPRDERREAMRDLYRKSREISELMTMQRDVLLNDYAAQALGLDADQTQGFIDYMQTVNEMTSSSMMRGGR